MKKGTKCKMCQWRLHDAFMTAPYGRPFSFMVLLTKCLSDLLLLLPAPQTGELWNLSACTQASPPPCSPPLGSDLAARKNKNTVLSSCTHGAEKLQSPDRCWTHTISGDDDSHLSPVNYSVTAAICLITTLVTLVLMVPRGGACAWTGE